MNPLSEIVRPLLCQADSVVGAVEFSVEDRELCVPAPWLEGVLGPEWTLTHLVQLPAFCRFEYNNIFLMKELLGEIRSSIFLILKLRSCVLTVGAAYIFFN